jgi:hypothetical protein
MWLRLGAITFSARPPTIFISANRFLCIKWCLHQFELKGMRRSYAEVVSSSLVWANGDRWMPSPAAARGKVRFRFPCLVTEFWKEDGPVMVGRAAGPFDLNSSISVKPILG